MNNACWREGEGDPVPQGKQQQNAAARNTEAAKDSSSGGLWPSWRWVIAIWVVQQVGICPLSPWLPLG